MSAVLSMDVDAGASAPTTAALVQVPAPIDPDAVINTMDAAGDPNDVEIHIDFSRNDAAATYKNLVETGTDPDRIPKGICCLSCRYWNPIVENTGYKWWALVRARRVGVFYEHHAVVKDWVEGFSNSDRKSYKARDKAVAHFEEALARGVVNDIHGKVKAMGPGNTPIYFTAEELLEASHTVPPSGALPFPA